MPDREKREQLLRQIDKVEADARRLALDHYIYREVRSIVSENSNLQGGYFFTWMFDNFVVTTAMSVRRLADGRSDVVSLRNLLQELRENPHLFSRDYFVELCSRGNLPEEIHQRTYDRLVGHDMEQLSRRHIGREIAELEEKTRLIRDLANRKFAHSARAGEPEELPTFETLEDCLDFFQELVKKYMVLMRGTAITTLLPTFQYDWKQPLRFPWISEESD